MKIGAFSFTFFKNNTTKQKISRNRYYVWGVSGGGNGEVEEKMPVAFGDRILTKSNHGVILIIRKLKSISQSLRRMKY